ncbi:MAG: hypothetical protein ABIH86_00590 [Planctomycetota bacterium]
MTKYSDEIETAIENRPIPPLRAELKAKIFGAVRQSIGTVPSRRQVSDLWTFLLTSAAMTLLFINLITLQPSATQNADAPEPAAIADILKETNPDLDDRDVIRMTMMYGSNLSINRYSAAVNCRLSR